MTQDKQNQYVSDIPANTAATINQPVASAEKDHRYSLSAVLCYQDIYNLLLHNDDILFRYKELYRIFNEAIRHQTESVNLYFSGPFARMDYLCKLHQVSAGMYRRINSFRAKVKAGRTKTTRQLQADFLQDAKTVTDFIAVIYREQPFGRLEQLLPETASEPTHIPKLKPSMRVAVAGWDDNYIYAHTADEDSSFITIAYTGENFFGDWSYIAALLSDTSQLNLIRPRVENAVYHPELIIFEPDYLIDITAIARCFEPQGTASVFHLLHKIEPVQQTKAMLLGNLAGQLLDEIIYTKESDYLPYTESAMEFFRKNPLALITCRDMTREFHADAQNQKKNIVSALEDFKTAYPGFSTDNMLVEPSFFCEMLGIQGRMDMLQTDMKFLLEQKSGKNDEWNNRHKETHYVQMLLYLALLHYNYDIRHEEIDCFLYYSKYEHGIFKEGPAPLLLFDALKIRNEIVHAEFGYSHGTAAEILKQLQPDELNFNRLQGTLWERYIRPKLETLLAPIHEADETEFAYFARFFTFLEKEYLLSKAGNNTKEAGGFASVWNATLDEKKLAGNIYDELLIVSQAVSERSRSYDTITLEVSAGAEDFLPNFRVGDIIVLYAYEAEQEPDIRRSMTYRGNIKAIKENHVVVVLRSPQRNASIFINRPGFYWAIEHDFVDSSYNGLFKGLYALLTATPERKALLFNRRLPRKNPARRLNGDYGAFNTLMQQVKQADDYFLLIGPPGTGKTSHGLINILKEELTETHASVLIASYTNRAVDEICEKLCEHAIPFIRLGTELTTGEPYRPFLLSRLTQACNRADDVKNLLLETRVIVGTTTTLASNNNLFSLKTFSLAIIDEASQLLEPHLLPLLAARHADKDAIGRFVLIGDHKQLPAVVQQLTDESAVTEAVLHQMGLTNCRNSLFERLIGVQQADAGFTYMMCKQGRMHPDVSVFPNYSFYQMKLEPVPVNHQQRALHFPIRNEADGKELLLSTARLAFIASPAVDHSTSVKVNPNEARLIAATVKSVYALYQKNEKPFAAQDTIGIIVPYRNQISMIRKAIEELEITELQTISIDTVERYQGSQRDVIIYGFTIQKAYQLNFLTNNVFFEAGSLIDRKLNVALTRAKEQLILTGNPQLLDADDTFHKLIEYIRRKNAFIDLPVDRYCSGDFNPFELTDIGTNMDENGSILSTDFLPESIHETTTDDPILLPPDFPAFFSRNEVAGYQPVCFSPAFIRSFTIGLLQPVEADARTETLRRPFGFGEEANREFINWGRTDFRQHTAIHDAITFTPHDKVLLSGYYDMPLYYAAAKTVFTARQAELTGFCGTSEKLLFCDFGSGLASAGMAFADITSDMPPALFYFGIDHATEMQLKAKEMLTDNAYSSLKSSFSVHFDVYALEQHLQQTESPAAWLCCFSFTFPVLHPAYAKRLAEQLNLLARLYPQHTLLILTIDLQNAAETPAYEIFTKMLDDQFNVPQTEIHEFMMKQDNQVIPYPIFSSIITRI